MDQWKKTQVFSLQICIKLWAVVLFSASFQHFFSIKWHLSWIMHKEDRWQQICGDNEAAFFSVVQMATSFKLLHKTGKLLCLSCHVFKVPERVIGTKKMQITDRSIYCLVCFSVFDKRIGIVNNIFNKMKRILLSREVNSMLKITIFKSYGNELYSTLLYSAESWAMNKQLESRIETLYVCVNIQKNRSYFMGNKTQSIEQILETLGIKIVMTT